MIRALNVVLAAVLAAGCIESAPIVTGHRDAGASVVSAAPPSVGIIAAPDGPDRDATDCRHCGETLNVDSARGTLCRENASPSSASLLNDVVDCVCFAKCIQECAGYCAGAPQTAACASCTQSQCTASVAACEADK